MGDENRCTPVPVSSLIPGAKNSFSNMHSSFEVTAMEASAPPINRLLTDAIVASGKVKGTEQPAPARTRTVASNVIDVPAQKARSYSRGARVTAISGQGRGKKLTIIAASVGHTNKTHTPVHRVADEKGNFWLEVETKLKFR